MGDISVGLRKLDWLLFKIACARFFIHDTYQMIIGVKFYRRQNIIDLNCLKMLYVMLYYETSANRFFSVMSCLRVIRWAIILIWVINLGCIMLTVDHINTRTLGETLSVNKYLISSFKIHRRTRRGRGVGRVMKRGMGMEMGPQPWGH